MANNIYIWSTESNIWETSGVDIIYLATTPGANGDPGGQSGGVTTINQTKDTLPLIDALLDIGSDNLVTLAGNYTGAAGRDPYNLLYHAKLTLKEISGVRFSTGGKLNFSSQTGGPHTTADNGQPLDDRNIKIDIVADNMDRPFEGGRDTAYGTTQDMSTNGFLSQSGTLTVTGDASAIINVASRGLLEGLTNKDGGSVNNASQNTLNASAYKAENFYITNNFTGTLTADAVLHATSTVGVAASSNKVQAHGVWGTSSVRSDGYWGKRLDNGSFYGKITATANGSNIRASVDDTKVNDDGSHSDTAASITANAIGAYGIRSGADVADAYSGSITLDSHNGLNGYYGYNGYISVAAKNNTFTAKAKGDNGLTFSGNSVKAIGMASNSLTVNGMFLGEIHAEVADTRVDVSGGNGTKWSVTNNDFLAAGIYTATLVGYNTFAGRFDISNTGYYQNATDPSGKSSFARAYGIYASTITVNSSLSSGVAGTSGYAGGLFSSYITVTTSRDTTGIGGLSAAIGVKASTLTAEAFTGSITVNSGISAERNVGLDVTTFQNGNDSIFDMAGSINMQVGSVVSVTAGIMTQSAINMRISGSIEVPTTSSVRTNMFAIYAGDITGSYSYVPSGQNDNVTIAAGGLIRGDIDLTTGTNYVTLDSNASVTGDITATNGELSITVLLNQYGDVAGEAIAADNATNAIIHSSGKMSGTTSTGLTINLNNAKLNQIYKIIDGVDWGMGTPKEIGFLYNSTSAQRKNVSVGSRIRETLTDGKGHSITYETWIENNALFVQVVEGTPVAFREDVVDFQANVSDVAGQSQTVTFSWGEPLEFLATNAQYEFEYRIGTYNGLGDVDDVSSYDWTKSIVVMLNNKARSYNVYNIQADQMVQARVRVNQSSGSYYSDWTDSLTVKGDLAEQALVVGKVKDGDTYFRDGNTTGATSTTMDFAWGDVSADCSNGLQYYEMQYVIAKEDIAKEDWAALWATLETLDPNHDKDWGVDGTRVTVNGNTYTIFEHARKTTTINHMLVSRMNDGQFVYWRVQAYDNKNNAGGWTDGERFLVETRDMEAPVLNDPNPEMLTVYDKTKYPMYNPVWDSATQTASSTANIALQWTYNATDDVSGVNKYTWHYRLKGSADEYKTISFEVKNTQFGGIMTEFINGLAPGIYEAYLTVFDNVLKESSDRKEMDWVLDVTGPEINISANPSKTTINRDGLEIYIGPTRTDNKGNTVNSGDTIDADGDKVTSMTQHVNITINVADIVDNDSGLFYFKICYEVTDESTGTKSWKYLDAKEITENTKSWTINVDLNIADSYNWMFVAYDRAGNSSEYYFTSDGDSKPPVFVTAPTYDYTINPNDPSTAAYTLKWDAALDNGNVVNSGVAYYRIIFDSQLGLDDVIIKAEEGKSSYSYELKDASGNWIWLSVDTSYQIRVEACDWLYNVSSSQAEKDKHVGSSVINIIPDNDPPYFNDPVMNYHVHYTVDASGNLIQNVDLSWTSAEDSGSGVKGYWISYRKQGESEWSEPVWANHSPGTSKLSISGLADGVYEWKLYAVDKRGNESTTISNTWQKDTQAPAFADDASGKHGDVTFVGGDVSQGTFAKVQVTISWTAAVDSAQTISTDRIVDPSGIKGYIVEYRYKLPDDADFGAWYSVNSEDALITGTSYTLTPDNLPYNYGNADYEWRVKSVDYSGNVSGYLEGENVQGWSGDTAAPVFDSTNLGSVVVAFDNGVLNATVSWTPGSDEYSGLYGYKLAYRQKDATLAWTWIDGYIAYDRATKLYTYQINGLAPANASYEWLVVAYDRVGNKTDETTIGSFDGDITAPVFDGDASAKVVSYIGNPGEDWKQSVTITWDPANDASKEGIVASGVEYYTLQFKLTSDPDSAYDQNSRQLYLAADPNYPDRIVLKNPMSPYINLYEDLGILLKNDDYTVRILATDKAGNTTAVADGITVNWTGDHTGPVFTVENIADITVTYDTSTLIGGKATQNVTVAWDPADDGKDGSGVRGYTIRYKLNDEKVKDWITVPGLITGNSYTFKNLAHGNYVFEITAFDNVGNTTVISSNWTGDVTPPIFPRTDTEVKIDKNNNVTINWKSPAKEDPDVEPQSGVKEYVFTFHREGDDGDSNVTFTVSDPDLSSYTFSSVFWNSFKDGTYTWSMIAVDYAGNKSESVTGDSFVIDREAPHGPNGGDGWFTRLPEPVITVEYNWLPQPGIEGDEAPVQVRDPYNITITFDASYNNYEDPTGVYFVYEISLDGSFRDESKLLYSSLRTSDYAYNDVYQGDSLVLSTENNGITRLAGYKPGTTFYWRARAVDGRGHFVSNWSHQVTAFQLKDEDGNDIVDIYTNPTKPLSVGVTRNNDYTNIYTVSWQPCSDAFGLLGYNIEISNEVESQTVYIDASGISNLRTATYNVQLNSGTYYFRVQAVDGSGRTGAWSDAVSYTVSEELGYENGLSSSWAYTLQNSTIGTNNYTASVSGAIGPNTPNEKNYCWYKFDLLNQGKKDAMGNLLGGVLNLTVTGVNYPLTVTVRDDSKNTIQKFTVKSGSGGISNILIDPAKYGERIYVYVESDKIAPRAQYTINGNITFFESPDGNSSFDTSSKIDLYSLNGSTASGSVHGWVGYQDKSDYYMVRGGAAATIQGISITGVTDTLKVTLYDYDRKKKASVTVTGDTYNLFSGQLVSEVYYVTVETTDGGKGKVNSYYDLNVTENYLPANNPSSIPTNTVVLDANGTYIAADEWVGFSDPTDYYNFSTAHAGALNISIDVKDTATLKVSLYQIVNGKQKKLKTVSVKSTAINDNLFKDYLVPVGDFLITVESGDKGKGKQNSYYDLTINDQYKHPASPNDSFGTADKDTLKVNQKTADDLWVGYGDPADYYEINLANNGAFNLGVYDITAKVKVTVYEKIAEGVAGKKIASAALNAGTNSDRVFKNEMLLNSGNYYVVVESGDKKTAKQETSYNLNFNGNYLVNDSHVNDNSVWDSDTVAQAQTLAANGAINLAGWVGYGDVTDFFQFNVNGTSNVRLDLGGFNTTNLKYEVRSIDTNKKIAFDSNGVSKEALSGAYYVQISTKNEKKYYDNHYALGIAAV